MESDVHRSFFVLFICTPEILKMIKRRPRSNSSDTPESGAQSSSSTAGSGSARNLRCRADRGRSDQRNRSFFPYAPYSYRHCFAIVGTLGTLVGLARMLFGTSSEIRVDRCSSTWWRAAIVRIPFLHLLNVGGCLVYPASRYENIRSTLDYTYHDSYSPQRIQLQDDIIDSILHQQKAHVENFTCNNNSTNTNDQWIVFTAGAMGSGKSHTIQLLHERGLFPLDAFVYIDPDRIRHQLPEFSSYVQHNPSRAGEWTRKESGLVAEILVQAALQQPMTTHVLVDGSLRDAQWYRQYFAQLRKVHPQLKLAILHVVAPRETVLKRAQVSSSQLN